MSPIRPWPSCPCRAPSIWGPSGLDDDSVGQFVPVIGGDGEVLGQQLPASSDGPAEGVSRLTGTDPLQDDLYHVIPCVGGDLGVNPLIGQDLNAALEEGDEDEDASSAAGAGDSVLMKGPEGSLQDLFLGLLPRKGQSSKAWDQAEEEVSSHESRH